MGQVFYPYLLEKVDRDFFIVPIQRISLLGILYHLFYLCNVILLILNSCNQTHCIIALVINIIRYYLIYINFNTSQICHSNQELKL